MLDTEFQKCRGVGKKFQKLIKVLSNTKVTFGRKKMFIYKGQESLEIEGCSVRDTF